MSDNGQNETETAAENTVIRIRPETRRKYERVARLKRWSYVTVADEAIESLLRTDPELRKAKRQVVPA